MVGATETVWFLYYINNSIVWSGIKDKNIHFVKLFYHKIHEQNQSKRRISYEDQFAGMRLLFININNLLK